MSSQKISCSPVDKNVLDTYIFYKNNDRKEFNELSEKKKNNLKMKFEKKYSELNYDELYNDPIFARSMVGNSINVKENFTKQKKYEDTDYNKIYNDPILARAMQHNLTSFIDPEDK